MVLRRFKKRSQDPEDDEDNYNDERGGGRREGQGGCCTWPYAIAFLLLCIIAGILTWLLVPWDELIGDYLPTFDSPGNLPPLNQDTDAPSPSPTMNPTFAKLPFSKCGSDEGDKMCCNGLESNCQKRINEIMYATSHNAMSSEDFDFRQPNHFKGMEDSLKEGFRAFSLDLCDCGDQGGLQFCHSICAAGKRDPRELFVNLQKFLEENYGEVVILIFQMGKDYFGSNPIPLQSLENIMSSVPGFTDMIYAHDSSEKEWPYIQDLVDLNQRIIIFHHETTNCLDPDKEACPVGFHHYFNWAVETPFFFPDEESLLSYEKSCALDRGKNGKKDWYGVNHFVTRGFAIPQIAADVNQRDVISKRVEECLEISGGLFPNFVQVDFWSVGGLPGFVTQYNEMNN
eukprot:CAMPEP_0178967480 /NCGR_PEP_ID=MMETSP0789-20121207/17623_1 /TAXON_ID=3005 /ORGANISM="Rhizosolenia setigera, Strain CCMP 1694" /LENGTH=398 /DNA_ID=CAMNT_0020653105 /DNA_START=78 /DNA_END=1274 /DNA_ORIENTATION=+